MLLVNTNGQVDFSSHKLGMVFVLAPPPNSVFGKLRVGVMGDLNMVFEASWNKCYFANCIIIKNI